MATNQAPSGVRGTAANEGTQVPLAKHKKTWGSVKTRYLSLGFDSNFSRVRLRTAQLLRSTTGYRISFNMATSIDCA